MKANKKKIMNRAVSLLTICFFLASQVSFANPGVGIEIAVNREMPGFLRIDIPTELASLDGIWEAPPASNSKVVLHIQNAHANYGAQKKIKELLEYLNKTYAIKTIFVEGAAEDLNPDFLKLFPDKARNLELADLLAQQGELTGAELFLLDQDGATTGGNEKSLNAPKGYGIEDAGLYRNNYEALKKVFGSEVLVNRYLSGYESRLQALASKIFTNDLRRVLSDWQKFEKGHREFMPYVRSLAADAKRVLKLDLESLFAQVEWPQITRLLVLQGMEKDLDTTKALEEKDKLLVFLKAKGISPGIIAEVENFKEQRMSVRQGRGDEMPPRDVLEALIKEAGPKGFSFRDYPAFSLYAGYLILKNELDAKGLFAEIKTLFEKILDSLAVAPDQKGLLELYRDEELARKLLRLELSRRDWKEALGRKTEVQIDSLLSRLKELSAVITKEMNLAPSDLETKKLSPKFREQVLDLYSAAFSFYEFARQRESVFYEKINAAMTRDASNKAIVITGGFHTDGVTDLFREHNVSYGVLTPRLMEKSDEKMYRNTMLQNEQQLFSISYLELALKLQSPEVFDAQGFVSIERLGTEWKNFMKVGHFTDVQAAIDVFNVSVAATKASIKLSLAGRDESGKERLKLEKIARSEVREFKVGKQFKGKKDSYAVNSEGLIVAVLQDGVTYGYDKVHNDFVNGDDKAGMTQTAMVVRAAMDVTRAEDPTITEDFSKAERGVINDAVYLHDLNFNQAQKLVQALAPVTIKSQKTEAAKFFINQLVTAGRVAKPVKSGEMFRKSAKPFLLEGFANALAKAIKSGVSLDRFNAVVRDSGPAMSYDYYQKGLDSLLDDNARAQKNAQLLHRLAELLAKAYIEEFDAPFFTRLFQGKMSSLAITKALVSEKTLKKQDLAKIGKEELQLMQELTPEQITQLDHFLEHEYENRNLYRNTNVIKMNLLELLGVNQMLPSLAEAKGVEQPALGRAVPSVWMNFLRTLTLVAAVGLAGVPTGVLGGELGGVSTKPLIEHTLTQPSSFQLPAVGSLTPYEKNLQRLESTNAEERSIGVEAFEALLGGANMRGTPENFLETLAPQLIKMLREEMKLSKEKRDAALLTGLVRTVGSMERAGTEDVVKILFEVLNSTDAAAPHNSIDDFVAMAALQALMGRDLSSAQIENLKGYLASFEKSKSENSNLKKRLSSLIDKSSAVKPGTPRSEARNVENLEVALDVAVQALDKVSKTAGNALLMQNPGVEKVRVKDLFGVLSGTMADLKNAEDGTALLTQAQLAQLRDVAYPAALERAAGKGARAAASMLDTIALGVQTVESIVQNKLKNADAFSDLQKFFVALSQNDLAELVAAAVAQKPKIVQAYRPASKLGVEVDPVGLTVGALREKLAAIVQEVGVDVAQLDASRYPDSFLQANIDAAIKNGERLVASIMQAASGRPELYIATAKVVNKGFLRQKAENALSINPKMNDMVANTPFVKKMVDDGRLIGLVPKSMDSRNLVRTSELGLSPGVVIAAPWGGTQTADRGNEYAYFVVDDFSRPGSIEYYMVQKENSDPDPTGYISARAEAREAVRTPAKIYADQIKLVLQSMPVELAKLDLDRGGLGLSMVRESLNSLLDSNFKESSPADILQKLRAIASVMSVDSQLAGRTSRPTFSFEGENLIITYPSNRGEVVISGLRSIGISDGQFLVTHWDSVAKAQRINDSLPLQLSEPILQRMTYSEFSATKAVAEVVKKALPKLSDSERETLMSTTFGALQKIAGDMAVNDLSPEMQVTLVLTRGLAPEGNVEAAIRILARIAALVDNADFAKKLQRAVPNSTIPMNVEVGKAARLVEGGFNDKESADQYFQQLFVAYLMNPNVKFRVLALGGSVNAKQLSDSINATANKFKKVGFVKQVSVLVLDRSSPVATQRNAAKKFLTGYVVSGTEATFGQLGDLGLEIEGVNLLRLWQDAAVSNDSRVWSAVVKAAQNITGGNVGSSENIALLKQIAESGQKPGFAFDDKNRIVINLSSLSELKAIAALYAAFQQIAKAA